MNKRPVLMACCILLAASSGQADDVFSHPRSVADVAGILPRTMSAAGQMQVLRGRFSQHKILREIPTPLASAGEFILANKLGIWWHTQTPFDSEFILSGGGMVQRSAGVEAANVSGDRQPELRLASTIFFALFTLDVEALSNTFDLYGVSDHNRWQLGLRPKSAAIATLFKDALISGGANVERVLLYESNGDTTEINLRDLRSEQTALKPAERERLGFSK